MSKKYKKNRIDAKKRKNWLTVLSIQYYNGNNESKRKVEE